MTAIERARLLREAFARRIMVLDGAMGTMIQSLNLAAADFGGPDYEGCNEHLNLTRPEAILDIHRAYLDAGADLISSNSFGCAPYVLAEYDLGDRAYDFRSPPAGSPAAPPGALDRRPAAVRRRGDGAGHPLDQRHPEVTFAEVREGYYVQARALIEGGVDALLLETAQDTLNLKAAAIGVRRAMAEAGVELPLMVSGTIEPMGTMLAGQGVDALYASLEHLGLSRSASTARRVQSS